MVRIRKFKRIGMADAQRISNLIRITLDRVSGMYYPKRIINNLSRDYSANMLRNNVGNRITFTALMKEKLVGVAQLTADGWICAMFVLPEYQNQGVGKKLLEIVKKTAKKLGFRALRAHTSVNSVEFYRKFGFRVLRKVRFRKAGETYKVMIDLR